MKNWIAPIIIVAGILIFSVAVMGNTPAKETSVDFEAAALMFEEGKLQEAESKYLTLIENDQISPAVFYNLALTQEALEKPGSAILNLERAATLDPRDKTISTKLTELRKNSGNPSLPPPSFRQSIPVNWWAFATLLIGLFIALIPLSRIFKFPLGHPGIIILLCLIVFRMSRKEIRNHERDTENRSVVLAADTPLRISPFEGAKSRETLPAGRIIRPEDKESHEGYQLVKTTEGNSGWLKTSEFTAITDW